MENRGQIRELQFEGTQAQLTCINRPLLEGRLNSTVDNGRRVNEDATLPCESAKKMIADDVDASRPPLRMRI
nr:hypothetical protein Itr_chr07CG06280 [Ipomoea trifida]